MAKILLMENEKILQDSNDIVQVQEIQQKDSEIITKESVQNRLQVKCPKIISRFLKETKMSDKSFLSEIF